MHEAGGKVASWAHVQGEGGKGGCCPTPSTAAAAATAICPPSSSGAHCDHGLCPPHERQAPAQLGCCAGIVGQQPQGSVAEQGPQGRAAAHAPASAVHWRKGWALRAGAHHSPGGCSQLGEGSSSQLHCRRQGLTGQAGSRAALVVPLPTGLALGQGIEGAQGPGGCGEGPQGSLWHGGASSQGRGIPQGSPSAAQGSVAAGQQVWEEAAPGPWPVPILPQGHVHNAAPQLLPHAAVQLLGGQGEQPAVQGLPGCSWHATHAPLDRAPGPPAGIVQAG